MIRPQNDTNELRVFQFIYDNCVDDDDDGDFGSPYDFSFNGNPDICSPAKSISGRVGASMRIVSRPDSFAEALKDATILPRPVLQMNPSSDGPALYAEALGGCQNTLHQPSGTTFSFQLSCSSNNQMAFCQYPEHNCPHNTQDKQCQYMDRDPFVKYSFATSMIC